MVSNGHFMVRVTNNKAYSSCSPLSAPQGHDAWKRDFRESTKDSLPGVKRGFSPAYATTWSVRTLSLFLRNLPDHALAKHARLPSFIMGELKKVAHH